MRILNVTNKVRTFSLAMRNSFEPLLRLGHEIIWAADFSQFIGDKNDIPAILEQITINTNPLKLCNLHAYRQLIDIIDKYDINGVMCSTPIGGLIARLAAHKKKINPVLYAAHGFLFFDGAPFINRTLYKLEEIILAHYTDALVTIIPEDLKAAQRFKLRSNEKPYLVHGAGINVGTEINIDKVKKRNELGISSDDFVIISAGELNKNKNTEIIIKALKELPGMHYLACGTGPERDRLVRIANKLGVSDRFHLLGYRTDILELMSISDVFTIMSFREGLPRALLEAMDLGLPCVGSNTRGIRDLIDSEGGFICNPNNPNEFSRAFSLLKNSPNLRKSMGAHNQAIVYNYSAEVVKQELFEIYSKVFRYNNFY